MGAPPTTKPGIEHALGKTNVPRVIYPTIRGTNRRLDPDGGHASPYILGLDTNILTVYVTPVGELEITFTSDVLADALADINAVSPLNLRGIDDDGYIRLVNLNGGDKNSLTIVSGTAAVILGFVTAPEPGSASYAGDIATSAPGRTSTSTQDNPHNTNLVAADENLTSNVLNRSVAGALTHVERLVRELDVEVPYVKRIQVTVEEHVGTGKMVFYVNDNDLRIPVMGLGIDTLPVSQYIFERLVNIRFYPGDIDYMDTTQNPVYIQTVAAYYNDGSISTANDNATFAAWGTVDGKSIFGSSLTNKQAAVDIAFIRGNVIEAPDALFQTNICQPGDTVIIEDATNTTPFNHSGEYVITDVLDETRIMVRGKASHETFFVSSNYYASLNTTKSGGEEFGTVRVIIGSAIPASNVMFQVSEWTTPGFYYARIVGVKRIRDLEPGDLLDYLAPQQYTIGAILNYHLTGANAHIAANLDAPAASGSPHSLSADTVAAQLAALLTLINGAIAGEVAYAGGIAWANGTTNPATTVELQLDKIINDLAAPSTDGVAKIRGYGSVNLTNGTLRAQLEQLAVEWFRLSAANTVTGNTVFNCLVDLLGDTRVVAATLLLGVTNGETVPHLKHAANPGAGEHKFIWDMGLSPPGVVPHFRIYLNDTKQLEFVWNAKWVPGSGWLSDDNTQHSIRLLVGGNGMYLQYKSIPGAAFWLESVWASAGNFLQVDPTVGTVLVDGADGPLLLSGVSPSAATGMGPSVTPKNTVRVHGYVQTNGSGGFTLAEGFNYTAVMDGLNLNIQIIFGTALTNANYTVIANVTNYSGDTIKVETLNKLVTGVTLPCTRLISGTPTLMIASSDIIALNFMILGE